MPRTIAVVMMICLLCSKSYASETDWLWRFHEGSYGLDIGTSFAASDDIDASDERILSPQATYIAVLHEHGVDGWTGDTGFYSTDVRAPLSLIPGQSKTWTFYVWADPSVDRNWIHMMWGYSFPYPAFDKMEYRLTYIRAAEGATNGPVLGTSILLNEYGQGTWSLPAHKTEDGRTGYVFELTATVVAEPSCFAGLASGIFGLGCLALRRRRRSA